MPKYVGLNDAVYDYMLSLGPPEAPVLSRLREATARLPNATMQIAADQGAFMQMLVRIAGVKRYLEIGVFTGYSSLAVALALPEDGTVTACDVSAEYSIMARRFWREGGVDRKIDFRLGPALQTLETLQAQDRTSTFDMAFIDADKPNQHAYYEHCVKLVRPGGLILIDNSLWGGAVADPAQQDGHTLAIRDANERVSRDARVEAMMLPIGDGLLMARRKP
jgi:predicted O-methyltransferase YrrM